MDEGKTLELMGRIYDAAVDPSRWAHFLEGTADWIGARSGILFFRDLAEKKVGFMSAYEVDPRLLAAHDARYLQVDVWGRWLEEKPAGIISTTAAILPDRELMRTPFYNDYLRPFDIFHAVGGFYLRHGDWAAQIGFQRPKRIGPFEAHELRRLAALVPHLKRAATISRHIAGVEDDCAGSRAALDHLEVGTVVVDERGMVAQVNRRAEEQIAAGMAVTVRGRRLAPADHREQVALDKLLRGAVQTGNGKGLHPGGAMMLHDAEGAPALQAQVSPLRTGCAPLGVPGRRIAAVIFLTEAARSAPPPGDVLRMLHGLTPAEARLAAGLAEGLSLEELAARHGLSRNTLRNQLKIVFDKTGVRRQAELVRLVLSGPAGILREN